MLLRNLATALLEHGKIQTTLAKAKEVQPFTEKLITLAKDGWNLDHFRRCLAVLTSKEVAFKLFHEIGPRFKERSGGYTRIYKLAKVRQGDAAPMAVIALLGENETIKAPGQAGRRRLVSRLVIAADAVGSASTSCDAESNDPAARLAAETDSQHRRSARS